MYPCLKCNKNIVDHKSKHCDYCSGIETITVTAEEMMKSAKTGVDLVMSQLNPGDSIKSFTEDHEGNHIIQIIRANRR